MNLIVTHPTLILQAATLSDFLLHTGMSKLIEAMMLVLGGI